MTDKSQIEELRAAVKDLSDTLDRLGSAGLELATTIAKDGNKLVTVGANGTIRLAERGKFDVGQLVYVLPRTGQIYERVTAKLMGDTAVISRVNEYGIWIQARGEPRIILSQIKGLGKGDLVLLDPSHSMAMALLEKAPKPFTVAPPRVLWSDIGGCADAKRALITAVEMPYKHPKLFAHYNKAPPAGVLLYGPPGCGKTMLGKAVATSVNENQGHNGGFFAIKGPEVLDPYVGVAEAKVRAVFAEAREYKLTTGRPAVIFVDEAEAILGHRGALYNQMEKTIVPTFLTEMDGLEDSSAIVILCTNREDMLDPAVIRDGRIDVKIEISRPNRYEAEEVLSLYFGRAPLAAPLCKETAAQVAAASLYGADEEGGCNGIPHSGALLAGVVERAKNFALNRDLANGGKFTGICANDIADAVMATYAQEEVNNHERHAKAA